MTPEARVAAAIDVLDQILTGQAGEKTLTTWARKNRYAGSKDRAALRDLVFDALRQQRSSAHMGGGEDGRALMLGQLRLQGRDPEDVFTGQGYGPPPLSSDESANQVALETAPDAVRLDCPDWLFAHFQRSLGAQTDDVLERLRTRAPVFLRVNSAKTTAQEAIQALAHDDIEAVPHSLSPTALEITRNPRRLRAGQAYQTGMVELQDVASQAITDVFAAHISKGNVLDYCAGGGGKALALAAKGFLVNAHDAFPARMVDLPERAKRAGTPIKLQDTTVAPYTAVLCDAPCSGSGAWRRQPQAKWQLTDEALDALTHTQDEILDQACTLIAPGGVLGYATCSLLDLENDARADAFLKRHPSWHMVKRRQFTPLDGGDGFFIALFKQS